MLVTRAVARDLALPRLRCCGCAASHRYSTVRLHCNIENVTLIHRDSLVWFSCVNPFEENLCELDSHVIHMWFSKADKDCLCDSHVIHMWITWESHIRTGEILWCDSHVNSHKRILTGSHLWISCYNAIAQYCKWCCNFEMVPIRPMATVNDRCQQIWYVMTFEVHTTFNRLLQENDAC